MIAQWRPPLLQGSIWWIKQHTGLERTPPHRSMYAPVNMIVQGKTPCSKILNYYKMFFFTLPCSLYLTRRATVASGGESLNSHRFNRHLVHQHTCAHRKTAERVQAGSHTHMHACTRPRLKSKAPVEKHLSIDWINAGLTNLGIGETIQSRCWIAWVAPPPSPAGRIPSLCLSHRKSLLILGEDRHSVFKMPGWGSGWGWWMERMMKRAKRSCWQWASPPTTTTTTLTTWDRGSVGLCTGTSTHRTLGLAVSSIVLSFSSIALAGN